MAQIKKAALIAAGGLIGGFINGFLGAGGGIVLLFVLSRLNPAKGAQAVRDNFASVILLVLILSTVSAVIYSHRTGFNTSGLFYLIIPGMAGGLFGAFLTDRLDSGLLKLLFSVIIIIAGINMIF